MAEAKPILFDCEVRQVKSMTDHSTNIVLNLPEYCTEAAAELLKHIGDYGRVAIQIQTDKD